LNLATFVLVGLFFLLPFVTVGCVPGGYGRTAADGATTYRGVDLVIGAQPVVTEDKLRPPDQRRSDRLPPQPLAIAVVLLLAGGVAVAVAAEDPRVRRGAAAAIAGAAALLLFANQAVVHGQLADKVRAQLTQPIPAGHKVSEYVQTRYGFWLSLLTLCGLALTNLLGWRRLRRARGEQATPPPPPTAVDERTLPVPVDPWAAE